MTGKPILLVAHRFGNDPHAWIDDVRVHVRDVVEADVHLYRGELEVRHSKAIWPTSRLFEGRELLPRSTPRPRLAQILDALRSRPHLWLDLKGPDPRLGRRVLEAVGARRPLWVSARCWWQLAPFRQPEHVHTFMSVGSRWQRPVARLLLRAGWSDGIVLHESLASPTFVRSCPRSSMLAAWAVDDVDRALELLELGIVGLIIDDRDLLEHLRLRFAEEAL